MGRYLVWLTVVVLGCAQLCLAAGDDAYILQLRELAAQGDGESQFALALLYEYGGQGVAPDPEEAVSWFQQAGQAGIPAACLYLGIKYENGSGVVRDLTAAGHWYCCAARKGWAMAQFFLAGFYEKGKGGRQDTALALAWYGMAEEQGYPGAREAMAQLTAGMNDADREKAVSLRSGPWNSGTDCAGF